MPGQRGRIAVLLALSLLMTLNTSQAMTLCVRGTGGVALELLVGDHCVCEMNTPGTDSSGSLAASGGMSDGGWLCLDIPIPTSSCDHRASLAAASQPPCLAGVGSLELAMVDSSCAMTRASGIFPTLHVPLETVLLQV